MGNVTAVREKEHIVKDLFLNNDRQWHAPTRLIDPSGRKIPLPAEYQDDESPCPDFYLADNWPGPWPEHCYLKEEQHKDYTTYKPGNSKGRARDYFFDH